MGQWQEKVSETVQHPEVQAVFKRIDSMMEEIASLTTRISEVAAPSFRERNRAELVAQLMRDAGLSSVHIDAATSAIGVYPAADGHEGHAVALAAHIDTVFPDATDVSVRRDGNWLIGPGVGDNSANVAAILLLGKLLNEFGFKLEREVIILGTAGMEGLGDLRGMKQFMRDYRDRVKTVIPVDGVLGSIVHKAVGSRRFRVHTKGTGGHSFAVFGVPSAVHGLGRMIAAIADIQVPAEPKTTYNVGVIGGGTSINTIANSAWMEIDMRSESTEELAKLEAEVRGAIDTAAAATGIEYDIAVVGDRPCGEWPAESDLVQMLQAVYRSFDIEPRLRAGSNDANVPISLGYEAATISAKVGEGGHTMNDSVHLNSMIPGLKTLFLAVIMAAGWQPA